MIKVTITISNEAFADIREHESCDVWRSTRVEVLDAIKAAMPEQPRTLDINGVTYTTDKHGTFRDPNGHSVEVDFCASLLMDLLWEARNVES